MGIQECTLVYNVLMKRKGSQLSPKTSSVLILTKGIVTTSLYPLFFKYMPYEVPCDNKLLKAQSVLKCHFF